MPDFVDEDGEEICDVTIRGQRPVGPHCLEADMGQQCYGVLGYELVQGELVGKTLITTATGPSTCKVVAEGRTLDVQGKEIEFVFRFDDSE